MFEFENDMLIVDEFVFDPSLANAVVVRIEDNYYMINHALSKAPIKEQSLKPYKKHVNKDWRRASNYEFVIFGLIPRGGFNVEVGRPITADEFKGLCAKYGLGDDDISEEFDSKVGALYGNYSKTIKTRQIRVPGGEAIAVEDELRKKGVEASNIAPGRVNISTERGGYRENAGRPSTGRKKINYYVTEDENKKIREFIETLRKEGN